MALENHVYAILKSEWGVHILTAHSAFTNTSLYTVHLAPGVAVNMMVFAFRTSGPLRSSQKKDPCRSSLAASDSFDWSFLSNKLATLVCSLQIC